MSEPPKQPDKSGEEKSGKISLPGRSDESEIIYPRIEKFKREVPSWVFDHIAELSKNARTIHTVYVVFLIYCALTVITTPDRKIILDEQARLPIVNLDVPFSGFVSIAPLIAIFIFVYFQLHVQVIKRKICELYLKCDPVDRGRLYPWILNMAEESEEGFFGKLQRATASVSLWLLLLVVLFLLTAFTTQKRDVNLSVYVWVVSFTGSCLVILFWCRYQAIPGNVPTASKETSRFRELFGELECPLDMQKLAVAVLIFMLYGYLILVIAYQETARPKWLEVDLSYQVLIKEQKPEYGIYWVDMRGFHLERAHLESSVLIKADLRKAFLDKANLELSNLSDANLTGANLSEANLTQSNLSNANLSGAKLLKANLTQSIFTNTILNGVDLSGAILNCTDLRSAELSGAIFKGAFLINAKLKAEKLGDELCTAATLFGADLGGSQRVAEKCPWLLDQPIPEDEAPKASYPDLKIYQSSGNSNQPVYDRAGEYRSKYSTTHLVYRDSNRAKVSLMRLTVARKPSSDKPYLIKEYLTEVSVPCQRAMNTKRTIREFAKR